MTCAGQGAPASGVSSAQIALLVRIVQQPPTFSYSTLIFSLQVGQLVQHMLKASCVILVLLLASQVSSLFLCCLICNEE